MKERIDIDLMLSCKDSKFLDYDCLVELKSSIKDLKICEEIYMKLKEIALKHKILIITGPQK